MTAPTQRPASTSDARKRLAERDASATLVAELIGCKGCRDAGITSPAEPDADEREALAVLIADTAFPAGSATGWDRADRLARAILAAGYSRTPDAHLAAAKAEVLEDAALAVESDPGIRLGHNVSVVCSCLRCEVAQSCARLVRARAAALREQGGE